MKKKSPVGWHVLTLVIVLALVALVVYLAVNGVSLFLLSQFEWFRNWFWPIILVIAVLCIVLLIVSSKMKQNPLSYGMSTLSLHHRQYPHPRHYPQ